MREPVPRTEDVRPGAGRDPMSVVPPDRDRREAFRRAARAHVARHRPVPPFTLDQLRRHADAVLAAVGGEEAYRKFAAVLVSNEAWRDALAAVPFQRRLLLLPKCLRADPGCAGTCDEFGLLCADCGRCPIHDLKDEAERLGSIVLVAEGSGPVMALLRTRRIEAVVGVSCLSALEGIYPLMEAAAVPGIAVPLLYDGCANTAVDLDWVWEAFHLSSVEGGRWLDLDALRVQVESWFTAGALAEALGPCAGEADRLARQWLAKSGKRWRPFLAACAFQAFRGDPAAPLPPFVRRLALAVECFHKASLVHDDIEDGDAMRYGEETLHVRHGVPIALNVGDFLLGEGYRLAAESGAPADRLAEMLRAAAWGHRELALGQGAELAWVRSPRPLTPDEVLDIFRRKTAPAFEVALGFGTLAAGADGEVARVLHGYSEALGIAYQIRDDLKDWRGQGEDGDLSAMRPTILLAVAWDRARPAERRLLEGAWGRGARSPETIADVRRLIEALGAEEEARRLLVAHRERAIEALEPLTSAALKGLLRRVLFMIFHDLEPPESIREPEAEHAPGRAAGSTRST